jgi:Flp pilus assembly protein TadB
MNFALVLGILSAIGFLVFLGIGSHILLGYEIIRKISKAYEKGEDVKELESKIINKSYLTNTLEKITTFTLTSIFLFEIEKYRYVIDVGYTVLFLVTLTLYLVPNLSLLVWATFFGATIFMIMLWIWRFMALKEFNKAFIEELK